jgi:murein DD-endopeptidase
MNRTIFKKRRFAFLLIVLLCTTVVVTCCTSAPVKPATGYTSDTGEKAAKTAISMIGRPYKYQGDSPSGFDCSGLVRYSYLTAGLEVPHGTLALKNVTRPVGKNMQIGDLLFFSERGKKYSHVGIFIGSDLFVHAPSTGQKVRKDSLKDPYWKQNFIEARRL